MLVLLTPSPITSEEKHWHEKNFNTEASTKDYNRKNNWTLEELEVMLLNEEGLVTTDDPTILKLVGLIINPEDTYILKEGKVEPLKEVINYEVDPFVDIYTDYMCGKFVKKINV